MAQIGIYATTPSYASTNHVQNAIMLAAKPPTETATTLGGFVNVDTDTTRHCTTYIRAKHRHTVSFARVFFGPPRPPPRLPFCQKDCHQLLMLLTSPSSLSISHPQPMSTC
ncbi:hypothetical protein DEO72_LG11g1330 [Vigna unguiculata]|uniref:Uncharacterized protein n=1 Tax=Vigna unguiculata TaxID=3917 RepID=A0A4D6NN20_VIGUN|nr:hypothetical protein DEO72_LG11g1330 [Vigna unguiculata]